MTMIQESWEQIRELVADAMELSAADRKAFVHQRAGENQELLSEAMSLLAASDTATGVIDSRTDAELGLGGLDVISMRGQSIGRYELEELIGEGAMSAVYRAWQRTPRREVAVKLFRSSIALVDARVRFNREANVLARLAHPNIAAIFESGLHPCEASGSEGSASSRVLPFIAMEFVRGPTITQYARQKKLTVEQRVELLATVARAVHAAHQQAVIHCDLKPQNVLVDFATGQPKVLDFGIARVISNEASTLQATAGVLLGTPGYMSPEQASASNKESVDIRSDIYSLGVMLFELLTNTMPLDLSSMTVFQTLRTIETAEPRKLRDIDPILPAELETVICVAMSRDKSLRYASAAAMADDLARFLRHEPLQVKPPGTWYVVRKFARRHKGKVIAASCGVLLLAVATITSSVGFVRAESARRFAETQKDIAQQAEVRAQNAAKASELAQLNTTRINNFLLDLLKSPSPDAGGKTVTVYGQIQKTIPLIGERFKDAPLAESDVRTIVGRALFSMGEFDQALEQFKLARDVMPKDSPLWLGRTADLRVELVQTHRYLYQPDEAQKELEGLEEFARPLVGTQFEMTTQILSQQAGLASDIGETEKAVELFLRLIDTIKKQGDAELGERLSAQNNLASTYLGSGEFQKAIDLLLLTIAEMEQLYGKDVHSTITARSNLAYGLGQSGQFEAAAAEYKRTADLMTPIQGANHPDVVTNRRQYAMLLDALGQNAEALKLSKDLLDQSLAEKTALPNTVLRNQWTYAVILNNGRKYDESIPIWEAINRTCKETNQSTDMEFDSRRSLGETLADAGQWQRAIELLEPMLEEDRANPNRRLFSEPSVLLGLTKAYISAKQIDKALAASKSMMEQIEKMGTSKSRASMHRHRGRALIAAGLPGEALPHLLEMDKIMIGVKHELSLDAGRRAWDDYRAAIEK